MISQFLAVTISLSLLLSGINAQYCPTSCQNGGICSLYSSNLSYCVCPAGFSGAYCQIGAATTAAPTTGGSVSFQTCTIGVTVCPSGQVCQNLFAGYPSVCAPPPATTTAAPAATTVSVGNCIPNNCAGGAPCISVNGVNQCIQTGK